MPVLDRVRSLFTPTAPRRTAPTVLPFTFDPTSMGRTRGRFVLEQFDEGYTVRNERAWLSSVTGGMVSSRREDGTHAPVFDIDQPVTLTHRHGTSVLHTYQGSFTLPAPAHLVPSRTPEHFHLYIEGAMSMRASVRLAKDLQVVDPVHIKASRKIGAWIVRLPA